MKHLMARVLVVAIVALTGVGVAAQSAKDTQGALTGKWTIKMADGPHGPMEMPMTLKQDDTKVIAVVTPPGHGQDFTLQGQFVKGELSLAVDASDKNMAFRMKATLQQDGSLKGYTSSEMGDSTWIATRVK